MAFYFMTIPQIDNPYSIMSAIEVEYGFISLTTLLAAPILGRGSLIRNSEILCGLSPYSEENDESEA